MRSTNRGLRPYNNILIIYMRGVLCIYKYFLFKNAENGIAAIILFGDA